MNFKNTCAGRFIGEGEFDFAVEAAGAEEGGVEDVYAIRRGDDLENQKSGLRWKMT